MSSEGSWTIGEIAWLMFKAFELFKTFELFKAFELRKCAADSFGE